MRLRERVFTNEVIVTSADLTDAEDLSSHSITYGAVVSGYCASSVRPFRPGFFFSSRLPLLTKQLQSQEDSARASSQFLAPSIFLFCMSSSRAALRHYSPAPELKQLAKCFVSSPPCETLVLAIYSQLTSVQSKFCWGQISPWLF